MRTKTTMEHIHPAKPFKQWSRDRMNLRNARSYEEPKTCSICGSTAMRQVRGVGFCNDHMKDAVEAATRQIGLA